MDNEIIKVGNAKWQSNNINEFTENENLASKFYSWGEFSIPAKYTNCNGNNLAIRKSTFDTQLFIDCDFSQMDASDSVFINCLFFNCKFQNANLHGAKFIGSAIMNSENETNDTFNSLSGAGMSQTKFTSSNINKPMLSNLNLKGCSFRHSVFDEAILNNVLVEYTSFEDAYFNRCKINELDLRKSACRGIILKDCVVEKYVSSVEKTLGAIGALQILESCKDIELTYDKEIIQDESFLVEILKKSSEKFLSEGKLFEFINIMYYVLKKTDEVTVKNITSSDFDIMLLSKSSVIDSFPVSKLGGQLYTFSNQAYEFISNNGKIINLDDILYSLKLMYFLDVNEYILLEFLLNVYKLESEQKNSDYSNFLVVAQINQYFQTIGIRIKSNKYQISFYNETASWQKIEDRNGFYEFCKVFIKQGVGEKNFTLFSMHEGSIEAIFEQLLNIGNILIAASLLGFEFEYIEGRLNFRFNPQKGIKTYEDFIKAVASIIPILGNKKPSKKEFDNVSDRTKNVSTRLKKYLLKNSIKGNIIQSNASRIVEETIKTTRLIKEKDGEKIIKETSETKRKIIEK